MKVFKKPTRVWINQPSTLQPLHEMHGKTAIAMTEPNGFTSIYFEKGDVHSMRIPNTNCLETKNSQNNVFETDTSSLK